MSANRDKRERKSIFQMLRENAYDNSAIRDLREADMKMNAVAVRIKLRMPLASNVFSLKMDLSLFHRRQRTCSLTCSTPPSSTNASRRASLSASPFFIFACVASST